MLGLLAMITLLDSTPSTPERAQPGLFIGQFDSYIKFEADQWVFYSHDLQAEDIFNHLQNLLNQASIPPKFQLKPFAAHVGTNLAMHRHSRIFRIIF